MKFRNLVATTLLTIAATGVTAATAFGQAEIDGAAVSENHSGVAYTASVAPDRSSAAVTLASGTFARTPDGIAVLGPDGAVVTTVPTTLQSMFGQQVGVAPHIDAAGTTLTLTPVGTAIPEPGAPRFIGDAAATLGGVAIGCAVGALIGLVFFVVGVFPGCVVGGLIGAAAGASR
ncbi:hypothetical protein IU486_21085 [Streptomyces gardneri]|uniref:hypothetical protein n=1 Tax=Nocardia TaxID=1817 RepID=UPI001358CA0D|nr:MULTISPECIES: hypothetical protein [Nocardia]MBF6167226.1 hypothetical protein [Streptomyces gardneri]MBF6204270.1 hypothetical protein [Streptomyces gardneri]UAK30532.1 hypothetical protein K8O92_21780 [Nocardia asteroides]